MLRRSTLTVMLSVCLVLAGYTLLLHYKLSFAEDKQGFTVTEAPVLNVDEAVDLQRVHSEVQQQAAVLQNVTGLAEEVASLAQAQDLSPFEETDEPSPSALTAGKRITAKRMAPPKGTQEPEIPEAPGYADTPVDPIIIDPSKHLTHAECLERRALVKGAMQHAWGNYVTYAFGHDELMPRSLRGKDPFGGLGATILDSLDTLWLMGMKAEYQQARDWVAHDLNFTRPYEASVFETTIRVVGGMLSAYELSQDRMFITRAEELVGRLLVAYDTPTGIPYNSIALDTLKVQNPTWTRHSSTLSEFGSEQLEFAKLSMHSGNSSYADKAESVIRYLYEQHPDKGLMPLYLNPKTGRFTTTKLSLGALGDSYYEYLLKMWLLKGRTPADDMYRSMWERAMDEMIEKLVFTSIPDNLTYVAEFDRKRVKHKMDHLVCFVPAMLALGSHMGAVTGDKADQYMQLAEKLTETCWQMYATQPTGLSPEYVLFQKGRPMRSAVHVYLLRPEAVEAFFVLWRLTGNTKYREYGWGVFQAIEKWCKVEHGYVGLRDVRKAPPKHDDTQQSFFLAETLKYLYLMFGSKDEISLDEWVFNTEAHPLRIVPVRAPAAEAINGAMERSDSKEAELVRNASTDRAPDLLESLPDVIHKRTLA
ncbi:hypothetical protein ABBQ38_001578 [Trebouxia sp. C0009 RCD-2024]